MELGYAEGPETFRMVRKVMLMKVIRIKGRNRIDAKKRLLDYYMGHRQELGLSMKDFCKHCIIDPIGKNIIFRGD
jgi:hypothetical protein